MKTPQTPQTPQTLNPPVTAPAGPASVDLNDDAGMAHWLAHFGATQQQLAEAVQAVGGDPARVLEHLLNQGASAGVG